MWFCLLPTDKDQPTFVIPETPQVAVFVSYLHPPKVPVRISVLGEMVSSESDFDDFDSESDF